MTTTFTSAPGDRPSGNILATRSPAVGRRGMIATSQSLASAAGLAVLQQGGNAIDAAVTAAGVLAVVEPSMNGIGGDLFALVYDTVTRRVYGLDASGRSARAATPEAFARRGLQAMPSDGVLTVNVPGVVSGWDALLARFGTLSMASALAPAIRYAHEGFPVAELMANEWAEAAPRLAQDPAAMATFLPHGTAPAMGGIFSNRRLATSLELIARDGPDAFYRGPIATAIEADMRARDGLLTADDFASHTPDWVDTIHVNYRGVDVHEMPPSTQGFVALEMLNILEGFDIRAMGHNSADYLHLVSEAKKIAFADRGAYLADRAFVPDDVLPMLLSKDYAARRRLEIDMRKAATYGPAALPGSTPAAPDFAGRDRGDTVYLSAADDRGNVVSFIQSLFASFGAGIVAGDTGITLHNRGCGFVLTPGHPNQIAPGKRPLHTLVPAMVVRDGRPWVSFGVMGGDNQAQAHAQVVMNLVDFGMHVQAAGEAARMRHMDTHLALEQGIGPDVRASLEARGHRLRNGRAQMGGYQAVMIEPATGVLLGGSDPRKDGVAIGW
ncbi:MAG: gamma-glutamyltransferase [Acidobacteria bacterium]|nr:gamma-glutamyltransferase [Acidobacteriota bacterium]